MPPSYLEFVPLYLFVFARLYSSINVLVKIQRITVQTPQELPKGYPRRQLFIDSRKDINHGIPSDQLALFNPLLFNFAKDAQRLATLLLFGQGLQPPFHLGGQLTGTD